jgi:hypothetical protein
VAAGPGWGSPLLYNQATSAGSMAAFNLMPRIIRQVRTNPSETSQLIVGEVCRILGEFFPEYNFSV